jgi:hypothetical protein
MDTIALRLDFRDPHLIRRPPLVSVVRRLLRIVVVGHVADELPLASTA